MNVFSTLSNNKPWGDAWNTFNVLSTCTSIHFFYLHLSEASLVITCHHSQSNVYFSSPSMIMILISCSLPHTCQIPLMGWKKILLIMIENFAYFYDIFSNPWAILIMNCRESKKGSLLCVEVVIDSYQYSNPEHVYWLSYLNATLILFLLYVNLFQSKAAVNKITKDVAYLQKYFVKEFLERSYLIALVDNIIQQYESCSCLDADRTDHYGGFWHHRWKVIYISGKYAIIILVFQSYLTAFLGKKLLIENLRLSSVCWKLVTFFSLFISLNRWLTKKIVSFFHRPFT